MKDSTQRRSPGRASRRLGLLVTPTRFALVCLHAGGDSFALRSVLSQPLASAADLAGVLQKRVEAEGWRGCPVHMVLASGFYRLHQTDRPQVPDEERNAALGFALRDVIDTPLTDTVLDSFPVPSVATRGQDRVFVAVSGKARLAPFVHAVFTAGLDLQSIDIPELASRNLMRFVDQNAPNGALLRPTSRGAVLYVYHGDDLVVSRNLAGLSDLSTLFEGEQRAQQEQLLLETQRTLDYYESQIGRRPVSKLWLPPLPPALADLPELLRSNLGVGIGMLDVSRAMQDTETVSPDLLANSWLAAAAALRDEVPHAEN